LTVPVFQNQITSPPSRRTTSGMTLRKRTWIFSSLQKFKRRLLSFSKST